MCDHPRIIVEEWGPLPDGTPVIRGQCLDCGTTDLQVVDVEYAAHPVRVGARWLPVTVKRGGLAICAVCGRPIFPDLSPSPIVLSVGNGRIDLCPACASVTLVSESRGQMGERQLGMMRRMVREASG